MPINLACTECQSKLRLRDEFAGKKVRCPKCKAAFVVPGVEDDFAAVDVASEGIRKTPAAPKKPGKGDEERIASKGARPRGPEKKRTRQDLEEDDEADDTARSKYKPCPRCGERGAKRVLWTAWGSFYGPAMFTHVRCPGCGYAYNGKTGRSNLIPAIVLTCLPLIGIAAILGALLYFIVVVRGHTLW